jgi:Flp pilus assembly pilin Flp
MVRSLIDEESGATLVEYVLMVVLIAIAALIGVGVFGNNVGSKMNNSADQVGQALQ